MTWGNPTRVVTTDEMRLLDRVTSTDFAIPSRLLMENAGAALAREVECLLRGSVEPRRVVIYCGYGNNGGDGLVAARHLASMGVAVEVLLLTEQLSGDAAENLLAYRRGGGAARLFVPGETPHRGERVDVVLDALLGIGAREPQGPIREAIASIRAARERGARVVSADIPSGVGSDSGLPLGAHVEADVTVAFGYLKRGHLLEPGSSLAGELKLVDISIPRLAEARLTSAPLFLLREDEIRAVLPRRRAASHKGDYGHLVALAGSPGKSGAAALLCMGALRGGAGLVTLAARRGELAAAQAFSPELMGFALPGEGPLSMADLPALLAACEGKRALALGPGLFRGTETGALLKQLLAEISLPAVLDADALNALVGLEAPFEGAKGSVIITPHPGELARLMGIGIDELQADRVGCARRYSDRHRVTVLLKGARTLIAGVTGATAINPTGNPGMATAGSGDVLTGLVAALLCQGLSPGSAACAAAFVHGLAGDREVARRGQRGLVAGDLLDGISDVWATWNR